MPRRLPHGRGPRRTAAPQRQAAADPRRQPARPRRPPRPGRLARADGDRRGADEAIERQRRAHVALPERPLLARPLRPLRAVRHRRGEHRVARLLRRALQRPPLRGRLPRAHGQHGRARQEPSERHLLVARQRERLRPQPRRDCRLDPRPRPLATSALRGRDQGRLGGRAPRDRPRLPDVPRARRDRGLGRERRGHPAA